MRFAVRVFGIIACLALLSTVPARLEAEVVYIEDTGFVLEPPVGWEVLEVTDSRWTFNDFSGEAFLQIKIWPGEKNASAEELFDSVLTDIHADGEGDTFDYYGRDAVFATLEFNAGGFDYTGYGIFVDGEDFDLAALSFAGVDSADLLGDYIISALDSFALSPVMMLNPGPVSRYYLESYGEPRKQDAETVFDGQKVGWNVDMNAVEASQLLIEREAAILADYKPGTDAGNEAWERYYRMIYRDNYSRLDYPASLLKERIRAADGEASGTQGDSPDGSWLPFGGGAGAAGDSKEQFRETAPRLLLKWVQGFEYLRTGGSDLVSPLSAAAFQQGDCDSRSLLYIILLNHYGIDSALMVSSVYSHAMAAVDTEGQGARINADGKALLVAETTDDVGIGMIASDMADASNWLVIPLMEKEPWN